tara:strand:+ start:990 stop:1211 length:222 start_codon:yes stop_codon:yes gene_type:complete
MCILVSSPVRLIAIADSTAHEKTHTAWVSGRGGNNVQEKGKVTLFQPKPNAYGLPFPTRSAKSDLSFSQAQQS